MGASQDVTRSDVDGTGTPQAAPRVAVTHTAADTTEWARRPGPALDISISPNSHNVVIKEHPIEVKPTKMVLPDPDAIVITKPYESAVNEVLTKLDEYAQANGAKVEPSSVRSSITGPISWLLTREGIAEWVRSTFPVDAYDLTRQEADGTTRRVCQVRISKGFFSGKVQVTVPRYPGGEIEGDAVEAALGLKRTPSKGAAPTRTPISAAPDFASELKAQILQYDKAEQEAQTTRKSLGLKPNATVSEVQEMERLVAEIKRDVEGLLRAPLNKLKVTKQVDGTYQVFSGHYRIEEPATLKTNVGMIAALFITTLVGGLASGEVGYLLGTAWSHYPQADIPILSGAIGSVVGTTVSFLGSFMAIGSYFKYRLDHYLREPLQSKEPGSLGAIVESLRQAGLQCDIHIGSPYGETEMLDLKVSYPPKRHP